MPTSERWNHRVSFCEVGRGPFGPLLKAICQSAWNIRIVAIAKLTRNGSSTEKRPQSIGIALDFSTRSERSRADPLPIGQNRKSRFLSIGLTGSPFTCCQKTQLVKKHK